MSDTDNTTYIALMNHEEQYSIWPADRALPQGWSEAGKKGSKDDVVAWIHQTWTDMRPLSLRKAMAQEAAGKS